MTRVSWNFILILHKILCAILDSLFISIVWQKSKFGFFRERLAASSSPPTLSGTNQANIVAHALEQLTQSQKMNH